MELTLDDSNKLRDVFNIFDNSSTGHIQILDFKKLVREHFSVDNDCENAQEINKILDIVDNTCGSELNFDDFSEAVRQIVQIKSKKTTINECSTSPQNCVTNGISIELYEGGGDEEPVQSFQKVASIRRSRRSRPNLASPRHGQYNDSSATGNNIAIDDIGSPFARSSPLQQSNHSMNSANRKTCTNNSLADSLLAGSEDVSQHSACSDDIFDDIDGNFNELNSKVLSLQSQIEMLSKDQVKSDERNNRQRDENCQLQERIHILEEQLREVENLSKERFNKDSRHHKEAMKSLADERSSEIDLLMLNLSKLEKQYQISETKVFRLSNENNELKMDLQQANSDMIHLETNMLKMKQENDDLKNEKSKVNHGFVQKSQMVNELLNELENRRMSQEIDMISSKSMSVEYDNKCIEIDRYGDTMTSMKQEINELRHERDALKLNHLQTVENTMSIADEICSLSKEELILQLKDYQVVNVRIRQHLDWLTLRIIDLCPTILERV